MRPQLIGSRRLDACLRALRLLARDEDGIALVMALGTMLILTIALTTVVFLTAAGARDAQRTNAGQKAYALAESGINNAVAVLDANYPGSSGYPGDSSLLPTTTTSYTDGSVTWGGSLVQAPPNAGWGYQWNVSATGTVANPTGPTAEGAGAVTRTLTAVVPVVLPTSSSSSSSTSAINYVYGDNITFGQSVTVKAPVFAKGNLELANTAVIAEDIPASATAPASQNTVDVGGDILLDNPQNQIGHVDSKTGVLAHVEVSGTCSYQGYTSPAGSCTPSGTGKNHLPIWATTIGSSPAYVTPPTMTCCDPAPYDPAAVTANGSESPSDMGEWYMGADLGPHSGCDPSKSTGAYASIEFDVDSTMNDNAYTTSSPFNLVGSTYKCVSSDGRGELAWDGTTLTVAGTIFIDGSACICGTNAGGQYVNAAGSSGGTLILTGVFTMGNNDQLCVKGGVSGKTCDESVTWNPNDTSLGIIAYGDNGSGDGIVINKGSFQGLLMAYKSIDCSVSGTMVQGPVVSVTGDVSCGQSGDMNFPAIKFPTGGEQGFFGPNPLPELLPPVQFGGG